MTHPVSTSRLLVFLFLGAGLLSACDSQDSTALVNEARTLVASGDHKAAIIQLKNALAQDEDNAEARFELGTLYFEQLEFANAEKEFRRARQAGYAENATNAMIARTLLGQRDFQRVLDEVPASTGSDADAATLHALRATAELGLSRKDNARKTLQRALDTAPGNADVHLALAHLALADNDVAKARQALDEALRIDAGHRDSLHLKGSLLRATQQPKEAAAVYQEILRIDPHNVAARLALADLAIADGRLEDARKEVDAALKTRPGNLQARYTEAVIDFQEKKIPRARDHLAAVLKAAPDFGPALLLAGAVEYALGNLQTAETHFKKVLKAAPNNLYAVRLLAATQLRLGRADDAARTLAPALKAAGEDVGVLTVAGEIALARKDYAQAATHFENAAQRNPDNAALRTELAISRLAQGDSRAMDDLQAAAAMEGEGTGNRAETLLILNQLKQKQFDAALTSIAALEKKHGVNPLTWNYRGGAYLGKQDSARARDSFGQALKLDPAFYPAAANLAQLDLKDNRPDAARQRFEGILKADPKHLNAMLAMADSAMRERDEKAYVGWLEKAAAAHPQALPPRLALVRHLLGQGERNKALALAREALNANPEHPAALDLLGSVQLALGDTANAQGSYRSLVERLPGQAMPLIKLAAVQVAAKDLPGARKSLLDALRVQPDSLDAQMMLGHVEIQSGRHDEAQRIARQVQKQQPDGAAGFILEGDAALARKDHPAALAAFERAHKLAPSGALLLRQLQTLNALQRAEEGEKRLADWLQRNPQDAGTRIALAEQLILRKQYPAAVAHYLIIDRGNPGNLLVLNNLAWALHQVGDKRAVSFAEQALKLSPENAAVMDTYGWILANQGQVDKGLTQLRKALSKAPDNPEIQYHLAATLFKAGEPARAKGELERLLASGVAFPQEAEARALLKQIASAR